MDPRLEYLSSKISPILEPLILELLAQRPADPLSFMADWIQKRRGLKPISAQEEDQKKSEAKPSPAEPNDNDNGQPEVSSDDDDDLIDDLPAKRKTGITRKAVSAEAYGQWNRKEDFVARVIPKTEDQKAKIRNRLHASFLFAALDRKELEIVIGAMEERLYKSGDPVIRQGDEGDNLYIVESGELVCTKRSAQDQEPKFLKDYQPGEAFGELALLYNAPRAASISAKNDCTLWSLDRATFNNIIKDSTIKKRQKYESFLKSAPILATIDPYDMMILTDAVKPVEFRAGEFIIRQGEEAKLFYVLEAGEAYATKADEPGQPERKVMEYGRGDYFGELSFLRNARRAVNVMAKTDCACLSLEGHIFKKLLGSLDETFKLNAARYSKSLQGEQLIAQRRNKAWADS